MADFDCTGSHWNDWWLVDGSPDFALFPGGLLEWAPEPLPIRLHVGNLSWGERHIGHKHGVWVRRQKMSVAALVHHKLNQHGSLYTTEADTKFKISLRLAPDALCVLRYERQSDGGYWSVVTLYSHPQGLDGMRIGRYRPIPRGQ
jgi:hypothetical protein